MSRSAYYTTLTGDVKCRYDEKLKVIDNIDPYTVAPGECRLEIKKLPYVTMMDLVNYLILSHSFYTGLQLKAYKSLQAYKHAESGSVQEILAKQITDETFVVIAKVQHSQRKREKMLRVWAIILKDTSISSAHCTCMAGLSEVCSHVATVLFFLHARPNTSEDSGVACTEKLSVWPVPAMKNVEMSRVRDMDWPNKSKVALSEQPVPSPESDIMCNFLTKLRDMGVKPAICRILEPFSSDMEKSVPDNLPPSLDAWYSPDMVGKAYQDIIPICQQLDTTISEANVQAIELATRDHADNHIWFKYRAGRITASRFKAVCRTSIQQPSLTVVKGVCYPQNIRFTTKSTAYGIKHEQVALQQYVRHVSDQHSNFAVGASGFLLSKQHPEIGATPDALVSCDCCGLGCVEVKCPYLLADNGDLQEFAMKKHTCLVVNNGDYCISRTHCYYYQVQCQMFVTERKYTDFVVWSKDVLYIQRIPYDQTFFLENLRKALDFHNFVIKPELVSRYFTEKGGMGKLTLWCVCEKPDDGSPMLRCDNDDCEIQWFHIGCIKLIGIPATWFCNNCI